MGQLVGWDGRTYAIRSPRIEPAEAEALIEIGCPVVTYFPGGRLVRHDEEDAWPAWADARSAPDTVTAGRWEAVDGGVAVVLVWHD
jgi:sugar phosphate isomerase/epimerase